MLKALRLALALLVAVAALVVIGSPPQTQAQKKDATITAVIGSPTTIAMKAEVSPHFSIQYANLITDMNAQTAAAPTEPLRSAVYVDTSVEAQDPRPHLRI